MENWKKQIYRDWEIIEGVNWILVLNTESADYELNKY